MNRLLLTAAFLVVLWRVLAPPEPQVPPSLEAAAIRIVLHEAPKATPSRAASQLLELAPLAPLATIRLVPRLVNLSRLRNARFLRLSLP
jgi:hypothetical protein